MIIYTIFYTNLIIHAVMALLTLFAGAGNKIFELLLFINIQLLLITVLEYNEMFSGIFVLIIVDIILMGVVLD